MLVIKKLYYDAQSTNHQIFRVSYNTKWIIFDIIYQIFITTGITFLQVSSTLWVRNEKQANDCAEIVVVIAVFICYEFKRFQIVKPVPFVRKKYMYWYV